MKFYAQISFREKGLNSFICYKGSTVVQLQLVDQKQIIRHCHKKLCFRNGEERPQRAKINLCWFLVCCFDLDVIRLEGRHSQSSADLFWKANEPSLMMNAPMNNPVQRFRLGFFIFR